jgi:hypothetical protein
MKGYYTVKLMGGDLPQTERIALETRYVHALEAQLGGHARVADLCLAAASAVRSGAAHPALAPALQQACDHAEALAWQARPKVEGARFSLSAWSAADLS